MAMVPTVIGKLVEAAVIAELTSQFGEIQATNETVMAQWVKQAKVHGAAAEALIKAILAMGQVAPGIATAGGPAAQVSVSPGKII
jgi:hypothetical protein